MTERDVASPAERIRRMQAAAIERSLVDETATEPYLVLAGALETARETAAESSFRDPMALTPAMTATLALFGASRLAEDERAADFPAADSPPTPPMPPEDDRRKRLRVTGARVARDIGACSHERAAALARVSKAEVEGRPSGPTDGE